MAILYLYIQRRRQEVADTYTVSSGKKAVLLKVVYERAEKLGKAADKKVRRLPREDKIVRMVLG